MVDMLAVELADKTASPMVGELADLTAVLSELVMVETTVGKMAA
jgi:hypothetical protein